MHLFYVDASGTTTLPPIKAATKNLSLDGTERVRLKLGYTAYREAWSYAAPHKIKPRVDVTSALLGEQSLSLPFKTDTPALVCKLGLRETSSHIIFSKVGAHPIHSSQKAFRDMCYR